MAIQERLHFMDDFDTALELSFNQVGDLQVFRRKAVDEPVRLR
jgi:hypothetical protein